MIARCALPPNPSSISLLLEFSLVCFFGKIERGKRKTDLSGAFVGFLNGGGLDIRTVNDIKKKINP